MTTININEAKTHLSRYAKRVKSGETIILCDRNKPFAEIRPIPQESTAEKRILGQLKGMAPVSDSFFDCDADIEAEFSAGVLSPKV